MFTKHGGYSGCFRIFAPTLGPVPNPDRQAVCFACGPRQLHKKIRSWQAGLPPVKVATVARIDCIAALKALGELNRMRIVRLLLKDQLSVNEVGARLEMSQYNVSKHLKVLRAAGLLEVEQSGKQRLYTVATGLKTHLETNANVLELGCCTFRFDQLPQ